jgi:hypothetical protein
MLASPGALNNGPGDGRPPVRPCLLGSGQRNRSCARLHFTPLHQNATMGFAEGFESQSRLTMCYDFGKVACCCSNNTRLEVNDCSCC